MATQTANPKVDADAIVKKLLQRISPEQVKRLVEVAGSHSGQAVGNLAFEPGDELCPVFKFPFPHPKGFDDFLNEAYKVGVVRLFPYGVIQLEGVLAQVSMKG